MELLILLVRGGREPIEVRFMVPPIDGHVPTRLIAFDQFSSEVAVGAGKETAPFPVRPVSTQKVAFAVSRPPSISR